ncbi:MAG: cupin domain-containing protein [Actinomycetota bacterium]
MKIRNYREVEAETIEGLPGVTIRWVIGEVDGAPNFAMRIFEVEPGKSTPFHTHDWEHEIFILSGRGVVQMEEEEKPINEEDAIYIPPGEKHALINRGDSLLRFICLVPIEK